MQGWNNGPYRRFARSREFGVAEFRLFPVHRVFLVFLRHESTPPAIAGGGEDLVEHAHRQHPPQHGEEMRGKSDAIARFWAARLQRADHFFQNRLRRQGERHGLGACEAFFHARVIVTIHAVFAVDVALESRVGVGAEAALDRTRFDD